MLLLPLLFAPPLAPKAAPAKPFPLTIASIMRAPKLLGDPPQLLGWAPDGKTVRFRWRPASAAEAGVYRVNADGSGLAPVSEARPAPQASAAAAAPDGPPASSEEALSREESALFPDLFSGRDEPRRAFGDGFGGGFRGGNRGGFRGRNGEGGAPDADVQALKLTDQQSISARYADPDAPATLVVVHEQLGEHRATLVPVYVTRDGYTQTLNDYPKVGDERGLDRLALVVHGAKPVWVSTAALAGDRDCGFGAMYWYDAGKTFLARVATDDHKDRWIVRGDGTTGALTVLEHDHDAAWLGGPGAYTFGWLPDQKHIYFESERTGWAQLYTLDVTSGAARAVTSGRFEVSDVRLSKDGTSFYFVSSEGSPFERHLDEVSVSGGARRRIVPRRVGESLDGDSRYELSPDETRVAYLRSWQNHPPELYVASTKGDAPEKRVTNTPSPEWLSYPWSRPPIVTFKADDGATLSANLYRPAGYKRGGPAVIFVHGAGYLQNVHRWWSSEYFREYMFHHLLMAHGVAVLDVDYRGSAGYGRDWRTGIYRFMGGRDLDDVVDGARYLARTVGADPKRIGVYGGSYGGFMTLMAMFTKPGVFAAGAALRPVSDWANYNDGYTSDILNLPQDDPAAYRRSSPIYHAEGLKGALLICHGVADTNVHFQDTVRLVQRLIDLGKRNWSVAFFPVENHAFVHPSSWIDEYRRIFELFAKNLRFK